MGVKMKRATSTVLLVLSFIVLICFAGSSVMGQSSKESKVVVGESFIDGNKFLSNSVSKDAYIMGVIDGLSAGRLISSDEDFNWFRKCTVGMLNSQITAIVDKYLKNHPEEWHLYMSWLVYKSLIDVCPRSK